jgi:hypothetical protein
MKQRLLALTAFLLLASTLNAQDPRAGPPGGGMKTPDPVLFNGPPTPEDFIDIVALDSTQYTAYRAQYTNLMELTRVRRDSLLEFRRQMRDAMESGSSGEGRDKMQKVMGQLEKQQKVFDKELEILLKQPQYKRYEAWRKKELARAEREMR